MPTHKAPTFTCKTEDCPGTHRSFYDTCGKRIAPAKGAVLSSQSEPKGFFRGARIYKR